MRFAAVAVTFATENPLIHRVKRGETASGASPVAPAVPRILVTRVKTKPEPFLNNNGKLGMSP